MIAGTENNADARKMVALFAENQELRAATPVQESPCRSE
jgi:hypothetical protein